MPRSRSRRDSSRAGVRSATGPTIAHAPFGRPGPRRAGRPRGRPRCGIIAGHSREERDFVAKTADVVVIGSGGVGAATAYFLAKRGIHVALVDKFAISSQTSPRAAGLASTIRATDVMTRLAS